jgi:glutamate synthase domain-containing protein 2
MSIRVSRYTTFVVATLAFAAAGGLTPIYEWMWPFTVAFGLLTAVGVIDLFQPHHSLRRNYPIIGHLRWMIEGVRPSIRQYIIEGEEDAAPFSRSQRSLVYARAKNQTSDRPFGTLMNVYAVGYEFMAHSSAPTPHGDPKTFRLDIGGEACKRPYSSSIFNISAMSFGSLSAPAIQALNRGAKMGNFAHDTGEGGISPHHRSGGGDLIWEIGSGYFGCRDARGAFDPELFAKKAQDDQIKMIEIKMSQGAKPGHGGILPAAKVTPEIAEVRHVPVGVECISPARHSAFSNPIEMMGFIAQLRELSGGKPVGFKLCLGHPWEFMGMVKAMLETGVTPDFVVVDGSEGGTGAAPSEFANYLGVPMREGLLFAHNTLVGAGIRDKIKLGAAGKIISGFDIASAFAIGADWTNSGRGFMFALGCVQSLTCHTNTCPTGVATQDPMRYRALVVPDKAERVANFHGNTLKALSELLAAAGLDHPSDIRPHHLARRISPTEIRLFSQTHTFLEQGELLSGTSARAFYAHSWETARADSFQGRVL